METRLTDVLKYLRDKKTPLRPILSAISTPTHKIAKFLVPMLELLTTNEYTIKDSFTCAEELQSFDSKLAMPAMILSHSLLTFL